MRKERGREKKKKSDRNVKKKRERMSRAVVRTGNDLPTGVEQNVVGMVENDGEGDKKE